MDVVRPLTGSYVYVCLFFYKYMTSTRSAYKKELIEASYGVLSRRDNMFIEPINPYANLITLLNLKNC